MSVEAVLRRVLIAICVTFVAIIAIGVVVLRVKGPAMLPSILGAFIPVPSPEDAYPHAPPMPPVVTTPIADLLSQHEAFLKSNAPAISASLQLGLTDTQIDTIETKYGLKLPPDLRALYRWRDGTPRTAALAAFPDHDFVPLELALTNRDDLRKQVKAGTSEQQQVYSAYAGHRDSWVGLIVDAAGDGHFFDPARSESEGSFFFCFAEDGNYIFYPTFRNYLAAVIEGENSGVFAPGPQGLQTVDFLKAQQLWCRFGAQRAR
jgi:cell wall assembly regulator SMI1